MSRRIRRTRLLGAILAETTNQRRVYDAYCVMRVVSKARTAATVIARRRELRSMVRAFSALRLAALQSNQAADALRQEHRRRLARKAWAQWRGVFATRQQQQADERGAGVIGDLRVVAKAWFHWKGVLATRREAALARTADQFRRHTAVQALQKWAFRSVQWRDKARWLRSCERVFTKWRLEGLHARAFRAWHAAAMGVWMRAKKNLRLLQSAVGWWKEWAGRVSRQRELAVLEAAWQRGQRDRALREGEDAQYNCNNNSNNNNNNNNSSVDERNKGFDSDGYSGEREGLFDSAGNSEEEEDKARAIIVHKDHSSAGNNDVEHDDEDGNDASLGRGGHNASTVNESKPAVKPNNARAWAPLDGGTVAEVESDVFDNTENDANAQPQPATAKNDTTPVEKTDGDNADDDNDNDVYEDEFEPEAQPHDANDHKNNAKADHGRDDDDLSMATSKNGIDVKPIKSAESAREAAKTTAVKASGGVNTRRATDKNSMLNTGTDGGSVPSYMRSTASAAAAAAATGPNVRKHSNLHLNTSVNTNAGAAKSGVDRTHSTARHSRAAANAHPIAASDNARWPRTVRDCLKHWLRLTRSVVRAKAVAAERKAFLQKRQHQRLQEQQQQHKAAAAAEAKRTKYKQRKGAYNSARGARGGKSAVSNNANGRYSGDPSGDSDAGHDGADVIRVSSGEIKLKPPLNDSPSAPETGEWFGDTDGEEQEADANAFARYDVNDNGDDDSHVNARSRDNEQSDDDESVIDRMNESHAAAGHVRSNDRDARDGATSSDDSMLAALKDWKDWGRDAHPSARNNRGVGSDATGSPHIDPRRGSGQQKHNTYLLNGDSDDDGDNKLNHRHTAARDVNRSSDDDTNRDRNGDSADRAKSKTTATAADVAAVVAALLAQQRADATATATAVRLGLRRVIGNDRLASTSDGAANDRAADRSYRAASGVRSAKSPLPSKLTSQQAKDLAEMARSLLSPSDADGNKFDLDTGGGDRDHARGDHGQCQQPQPRSRLWEGLRDPYSTAHLDGKTPDVDDDMPSKNKSKYSLPSVPASNIHDDGAQSKGGSDTDEEYRRWHANQMRSEQQQQQRQQQENQQQHGRSRPASSSDASSGSGNAWHSPWSSPAKPMSSALGSVTDDNGEDNNDVDSAAAAAAGSFAVCPDSDAFATQAHGQFVDTHGHPLVRIGAHLSITPQLHTPPAAAHSPGRVRSPLLSPLVRGGSRANTAGSTNTSFADVSAPLVASDGRVFSPRSPQRAVITMAEAGAAEGNVLVDAARGLAVSPSRYVVFPIPVASAAVAKVRLPLPLPPVLLTPPATSSDTTAGSGSASANNVTGFVNMPLLMTASSSNSTKQALSDEQPRTPPSAYHRQQLHQEGPHSVQPQPQQQQEQTHHQVPTALSRPHATAVLSLGSRRMAPLQANESAPMHYELAQAAQARERAHALSSPMQHQSRAHQYFGLASLSPLRGAVASQVAGDENVSVVHANDPADEPVTPHQQQQQQQQQQQHEEQNHGLIANNAVSTDSAASVAHSRRPLPPAAALPPTPVTPPCVQSPARRCPRSPDPCGSRTGNASDGHYLRAPICSQSLRCAQPAIPGQVPLCAGHARALSRGHRCQQQQHCGQ